MVLAFYFIILGAIVSLNKTLLCMGILVSGFSYSNQDETLKGCPTIKKITEKGQDFIDRHWVGGLKNLALGGVFERQGHIVWSLGGYFEEKKDSSCSDSVLSRVQMLILNKKLPSKK